MKVSLPMHLGTRQSVLLNHNALSFFETGSLIEHGARLTASNLSPRNPPIFASLYLSAGVTGKHITKPSSLHEF